MITVITVEFRGHGAETVHACGTVSNHSRTRSPLSMSQSSSNFGHDRISDSKIWFFLLTFHDLYTTKPDPLFRNRMRLRQIKSHLDSHSRQHGSRSPTVQRVYKGRQVALLPKGSSGSRVTCGVCLRVSEGDPELMRVHLDRHPFVEDKSMSILCGGVSW